MCLSLPLSPCVFFLIPCVAPGGAAEERTAGRALSGDMAIVRVWAYMEAAAAQRTQRV